MSWGGANRPGVSSRVENRPTDREGADGDIQIRGTGLGAKLFAKWSSRWWDVPLSIDGVTKIGVTNSDYLSIDRDSIDVYKNSVKVAEFGSDIKFNGKIIIGNADGTFSGTDNVNIGNAQSGLGYQNIAIGYKAGEDLTASGLENVLIGYNAGKEVAGATANTCIGSTAGDTITTGSHNICIGQGTDVDSGIANERIAIGRDVVCTANETLRIGDGGANIFYDFSSSGGTIALTSDERTKKNITNTDIGLDFINALKPIKFVGKNKYDFPDEFNVDKSGDRRPDPTRVQDGFIAQDVKQAMDDLGVTFSGWFEDTDTRQMLGYDVFVVPLTKAVQELSTKIDTMQIEINNLK